MTYVHIYFLIYYFGVEPIVNKLLGKNVTNVRSIWGVIHILGNVLMIG